jgi:hypothetical protein
MGRPPPHTRGHRTEVWHQLVPAGTARRPRFRPDSPKRLIIRTSTHLGEGPRRDPGVGATPSATSTGRCRWTPRPSGPTSTLPEHVKEGRPTPASPPIKCTHTVVMSPISVPRAASLGAPGPGPWPFWPQTYSYVPSAATCGTGASARSSRSRPTEQGTACGVADSMAVRPASTAHQQRSTGSGASPPRPHSLDTQPDKQSTLWHVEGKDEVP